jgi:hypothetical protein
LLPSSLLHLPLLGFRVLLSMVDLWVPRKEPSLKTMTQLELARKSLVAHHILLGFLYVLGLVGIEIVSSG